MHARSFVATSALLLAALGCRDDARSPTEPALIGPQANMSAAASLSFWQVSAGGNHTCGLTTDYRAYCWGENGTGQLGDGTNTISWTPVAVFGELRFRSISAGGYVTCGITTDYRAYCWGWNLGGRLGDGTTTGPETCAWGPCSTKPIAVAGGLQFRQVDVGGPNACGVTYADRRAYCWGDNGAGQLGDGTTTARSRPVAVLGGHRFRQVDASGVHTCGVTTSDQAYCWGYNRWGQLGDSSGVGRRQRPVRVSGGHSFRQISAGGYHTCAVTTADRAYCWGDGRSGEIGNGKTYLSFWPRAVAGGLLFRRVTVGGEHTCAETTTNRAYCWGSNDAGQLGDGTHAQRLKPVAVAGGIAFKQVSAGSIHTCGKSTAAVGYCWGANSYGRLGDGTDNERLTPTPVEDPL